MVIPLHGYTFFDPGIGWVPWLYFVLHGYTHGSILFMVVRHVHIISNYLNLNTENAEEQN